MADVMMTLQEQLADSRSAERSYSLQIENRTRGPIRIRGIAPRLPEGVDLIEVQDPSVHGERLRHRELCDQLATIINYRLLADSEEFRASVIQANREVFRQVVGSPMALLLNQRIFEERLKQRTASISIDSHSQATRAREKFLGGPEDATMMEIFDYKLSQLCELPSGGSPASSDEPYADVAAGSAYSVGYTLRFQRKQASARHYSFGFEVSYSSDERGEIRSLASTSVLITPRPFILSVIAVVSGVLGVVVANAFAISGGAVKAQSMSITDVGSTIFSGQAVSAGILGLVVFNVYEHLDLAKRLPIGIGWRSALVVGALCGMFSERIIKALMAVIGV